ncbi:MAG: TolC family protein [Betaproteobacteria bacterium]|nr:TolC family protein [Betaproteobacteria bacterium]
MIGRLLAAATAAILAMPPAVAITPGEFVRAALANSANYRSAQAQLDAASHGVGVARAALLPQVRGQASRQIRPNQDTSDNNRPEDNRTEFSATLTQSLLNTSQFRSFSQAKHLERSAGHEVERVGQQVLLASYEAYLAALLAEANLSALKKRKKTVSQQLLMAESNFELGSADTTLIDELTVRAQLAVIDAEQVEAQRQLEVAMLVLADMIGRRPAQLHKLEAEAPLDEERNWQSLAENEAPAVQSRQAALEAAQAAEDATFALSLPNVSLSASAFNHRDETVAIRVDVPLFASGGGLAGARRAAAETRSAMLALEDARRQAKLAAADALVRAQTQQKRIQLLATTLQAQQRRLEATEVLSEIGKSAAFHVIDAASELADAEVALVAARHAKLLAVLSLKAAVGALDEETAAAFDTLFAN